VGQPRCNRLIGSDLFGATSRLIDLEIYDDVSFEQSTPKMAVLLDDRSMRRLFQEQTACFVVQAHPGRDSVMISGAPKF
jgi:hypothetical protein